MGKEHIESNSSRCCVIWDGNCPKSIFSLAFEHIRDLEELRNCDFSKFEIIYILAEIKWLEHIRSKFYGFQLGTDLRKKLVKCPIVFCSFMPGFNKEQYPDSKILDYPGHYLLRLPSKPLKLEQYKELDEDMLEDINICLFNSNQWVHELIHNTEEHCTVLGKNSENKLEIKIRVQKYLFDQLEIFKRAILHDKIDEFERLRGKLLEKIYFTIDSTDFSPDKLRKPLNIYKEQFYSFLPTDLIEGIESNYSPKRWQVLFVDDQESGHESVINHFLRNGITCHPAQNAEQAFSILRDDENGFRKIAVIICDFRLYVNGDSKIGKWQDLQGYQILKQIHSPHEFKLHYAYVMITSKKGTIQQYIKKRSKFPILWFNKSEVLDGENHSFDIFCQRIVEVGSDAFFRNHNIPNAEVWNKGISDRMDYGYSYFYKQHVESQDYEEIEKWINKKAIDNINNVRTQEELLDFFSFQISLRHKKNKMNSKEKLVEDNNFDLITKFRENILVIRRIIWGLFFLLHKDKFEIFNLVKNKKNENEKTKNMNNRDSMINAVFNTSLGISFNHNPTHIESLTDFKSFTKDPNNYSLILIKYGLLVEEFEFLEQNADQFNTNVSYIRLIDTDVEILSDFFSSIIDLYNHKSISVISQKLTPPYSRITKDEFELGLKVIAKKNFIDGKLSGNFKRATENFYRYSFNELSDDIKRKLHELKYW